ncbi:hypothetical protein [Streptomyces sp. NPDC020965]|uniref:hypothetical protein n=1 Tax=Streptomyces sp. NPDC020965 TaxID=3365105 RepID=UPI003787ADAD
MGQISKKNVPLAPSSMTMDTGAPSLSWSRAPRCHSMLRYQVRRSVGPSGAGVDWASTAG